MKHETTGKATPANRTDWDRVRAMSDEEIQYDEDNPRTTAEDWEGAVMKRGGVEIGRVRTRGPGKRAPKELVAIRYSPDVLAAFRSTGPGWQTRMNDALREWLKAHSPNG